MISECSKFVQKEYETRHDSVGKEIYWKLCKKFKFDHTNKWYMFYSESVLNNEMHKLPLDFEIQTDHFISARRPDPIKVKKKKKNLQNCGLCSPSGPQSEIKRKWKER